MIQTSTTGKLIAQHQVQRQQELDPTRTSTYAANVGNVFHGVNEVIPVRGFNYNLKGLDPYRKEHPDQPIMGTEVASTVSTRGIYERDTVNAYVPDYDSVAPPWASTAEAPSNRAHVCKYAGGSHQVQHRCNGMARHVWTKPQI